MHACVQAMQQHMQLARKMTSMDVDLSNEADEWLYFLEGVTKVLRTKNQFCFRISDGLYCRAPPCHVLIRQILPLAAAATAALLESRLRVLN